MANAYRDSNSTPTIIAVKQVDGSTVDRILANPTNHGLKVSDATTGTDQGGDHAKKDDNFVSSLIAVSSVDGFTPVRLYTDGSGALLVNSL